MNDFEYAFGEFIDRREFDQAESALFSMVRIVFTAGWLAAGGTPLHAQKLLPFYKKKLEDLPASDFQSDIGMRPD